MGASPTRKTEDRQEAHELVQRSGIPFPAALRVVRGEASLEQVLKRLLDRDIRYGLEAKGLPAALAGQVARGFLRESKAWDAFRAMSHPGYSAHRSLLQEACLAGLPLMLELFGQGELLATPRAVEKYSLVVSGATGGSAPPQPPAEPAGTGAQGSAGPSPASAGRTIQKHDLKWVAPPGSAATIRSSRSVDAEVAALGLSASRNMRDRLRLERPRKLDLLDRGRPIRLVIRDGDVLVGRPVWASRYEMGVLLEDGEGRNVEVSVFFHALLRITDAQSHEVVADAPQAGAPDVVVPRAKAASRSRGPWPRDKRKQAGKDKKTKAKARTQQAKGRGMPGKGAADKQQVQGKPGKAVAGRQQAQGKPGKTMPDKQQARTSKDKPGKEKRTAKERPKRARLIG